MGMSQKWLCMLSSSVSVCFSAVATGWECHRSGCACCLVVFLFVSVLLLQDGNVRMGMSQKRLCMLSSSVSVCFSAVAVSQGGDVV